MLTKYKVVFTRKAKLSIESQKEYYSEISKRLAKNFVEDIAERIGLLRLFPFRTKLNQTEMFVPLHDFPFIIIYQVEDKTVSILDVFHTATESPNK
jgi:plasmid stabilization system protein ParE